MVKYGDVVLQSCHLVAQTQVTGGRHRNGVEGVGSHKLRSVGVNLCCIDRGCFRLWHPQKRLAGYRWLPRHFRLVTGALIFRFRLMATPFQSWLPSPWLVWLTYLLYVFSCFAFAFSLGLFFVHLLLLHHYRSYYLLVLASLFRLSVPFGSRCFRLPAFFLIGSV